MNVRRALIVLIAIVCTGLCSGFAYTAWSATSATTCSTPNLSGTVMSSICGTTTASWAVGTSPPTTLAPTTTITVAPTTASTTTTTTPSSHPVIWSAGHEGGSIAEWQLNGGGNQENSGSWTNVVTTERAHSGTHSLKMGISSPNSPTSGVRMFRWQEPRQHRDAYYSAWIYIPTTYHLSGSQQWWNVFQFKSRTTSGAVDPLWAFYADEDAGGLYFKAGWGWGATSVAGPYPASNVSGKYYAASTKTYLPVGRWVHLEAFLHQSKDFDGAMTFWQDGAKLFDFSGIRTSYANCNYNAWCADNEWSVNLYSDGMTPNPASVYLDDASIALP